MPRFQDLGRALAALTLVTATLTACTTATPYQPDIAGQPVAGGYSEQRISADQFRVNFVGNSLTSRERVEGFLLYRAAELTVENGYDWFLIIDRLTEHDVRTYVDPDPSYHPGYGSHYRYWRPHWRYYRRDWQDWHPEWGERFWSDTVDVRTIQRFEAHAEIVMHRGPIPAGEPRAFDARRVMTDLASSIDRPGDRP